MHRIPLLLALVLAALLSSHAQKGGLELLLGVGVNYYYGANSSSTLETDIDQNRSSYFASAALGINTRKTDKETPNFIGIFGRAGLLSNTQLDLIATDQSRTLNYLPTGDNKYYTEVEFGVLARQFLRISAGQGSLHYTDNAQVPQVLRYYCSTLGVSLPIGLLSINLQMGLAAGRDFQKLVYQPSASLVYKFN